MRKQFEPCIIIENEKVMMYLGHPRFKDSTRIDVTMPFLIGLRIGSKDYQNIQNEKMQL